MSGRQEKFSPTECDGADDTNRVKQIPIEFSVIELLPMSQQIETLFPTYCTMGSSGNVSIMSQYEY